MENHPLKITVSWSQVNFEDMLPRNAEPGAQPSPKQSTSHSAPNLQGVSMSLFTLFLINVISNIWRLISPKATNLLKSAYEHRYPVLNMTIDWWPRLDLERLAERIERTPIVYVQLQDRAQYFIQKLFKAARTAKSWSAEKFRILYKCLYGFVISLFFDSLELCLRYPLKLKAKIEWEKEKIHGEKKGIDHGEKKGIDHKHGRGMPGMKPPTATYAPISESARTYVERMLREQRQICMKCDCSAPNHPNLCMKPKDHDFHDQQYIDQILTEQTGHEIALMHIIAGLEKEVDFLKADVRGQPVV